jgi:hypothetical protein
MQFDTLAVFKSRILKQAAVQCSGVGSEVTFPIESNPQFDCPNPQFDFPIYIKRMSAAGSPSMPSTVGAAEHSAPAFHQIALDAHRGSQHEIVFLALTAGAWSRRCPPAPRLRLRRASAR